MKKLFAIMLSVAMLAAMSVSAFAVDATITASGEGKDIDIKANYVPGSAAQTVYKVDVSWGSMEFTYTEAIAGVWDPETHTYTEATEAGWSCAKDANKITVTNHSNAAVTVTLASTLNSGITGEFKNAENQTVTSLQLATAENTAVENAPTAVAYFNITQGMISTDATLGKITITIG